MSAARVRIAALAVGVPALAGCSGIFQHARPDVPQTWAAVTDASAGLSVGSAERDVTPDVGCYLAGFDPARTSTGVASPLKVRALVLETGARRIAIVGIDNLGVMREDADWIKSGLAGFRNGDVFVCSSHTHAGPDLIGLWGYYFMSSGRDREYLAKVRDATAAAVAEARANAAPAKLLRGQAMLPPAGLVKNANRAQVFDRRVTVLHARAVDDGRPLGSLLHLACHPEVQARRNTLISADFVGALCDEWRARGHGQAVFANGALGAMISPDMHPRDETGVVAFGKAACDLCEKALQQAEPLPVDEVEVRRADVYLPMISPGFRIGRLTTVLQRELFDGHARSTVGFLRLGSFEALAVPGEMEPALAQRLRAQLRRPDLVVFGLCDDEVGYLLRDKEARDPEFAYERSMSPCMSAGELVSQAITGPL
ncbi:MAG TPA: neutral/alkaline non-lysosomal ceramidase N-terminal domain-containing protein [Planctomycetota bacterium]